MKTINTTMNIIDCCLEPKPIITVSKQSEMKAQIRELPFSKPVTCASPIGKAN